MSPRWKIPDCSLRSLLICHARTVVQTPFPTTCLEFNALILFFKAGLDAVTKDNLHKNIETILHSLLDHSNKLAKKSWNKKNQCVSCGVQKGDNLARTPCRPLDLVVCAKDALAFLINIPNMEHNEIVCDEEIMETMFGSIKQGKEILSKIIGAAASASGSNDDDDDDDILPLLRQVPTS
jgi:hypothetical protein